MRLYFLESIESDELKCVHFEAAGRALRVFFKCWRWPYFNPKRWGLYTFGAGPIGCMYWPKREAR